jgi:hypothetical protein
VARGLERRPEFEPARDRVRAPSAPAASPAALLLRGVGNRARVRLAAALAARANTGPMLQRQGWSDARKGGWNEDVRKIANTWRIPVEGIVRGNQQPGVVTPTKKNPIVDTPESAAGRAIVLVPPIAKWADGVEVLLQFHGHDVGYRERTGTSRFGVDPGTVRDVEEDLLPQQLEAAKRSMIAILPQGTRSSGFGITDPAAYVDEVLGLTVPILNAVDRTLKLKKVGVRRIVVSGHSGGGPQTVSAAKALDPGSNPTQDQWRRSPPILLFDALNGLGEVGVAASMVERWLDADLAILTAAGAGALGLLAQRGLKLRSTYSNSDLYSATNIGGSYKDFVPETTTETIDGKTVTKTKKVETTITIAPGDSLKGRIDTWFRKHRTQLAALDKLAPQKTDPQEKTPTQTLAAQYRVESVGGSHDFTLGSGHKATAAERTGVATPAPTAPALGVPAAPTDGNLARTLALLGPPPALPPATP